MAQVKPMEDYTMGNTKLATQKTNEMSLEGAQKLVSSVKANMALVSKGYLLVCPDVAKLYDCKGFKALGYKNFDEMCLFEFGMSHGTSVGIRKVFSMVGTVSANNEYSIPEKYLEYGYTKLLKIAENKTDFEKAGIKPFETFTPDMTIREMVDSLKQALADKSADQEANAIDTTASEVEDTSAPASENMSIIDNSTSENADQPATPLDHINNIVESTKALKALVSDNVKPEELAKLDAILAYMKDFKKLCK